MFGRFATIKLKMNPAEVLVCINQDTIVTLPHKQTRFRDESLHING